MMRWMYHANASSELYVSACPAGRFLLHKNGTWGDNLALLAVLAFLLCTLLNVVYSEHGHRLCSVQSVHSLSCVRLFVTP